MHARPPRRTSTLTAAALPAAVALVLLTGCTTPSTPDPAQAVTFTERVVTDVLHGDPATCQHFTDAGRADFIADMAPATTCAEAVDVLANAIGEHVEEFTRDHRYTVHSRTGDTVTVAADYGTYTDLFTVHWTNDTWRLGPSTRLPSPTPPETPDPNTTGPDAPSPDSPPADHHHDH